MMVNCSTVASAQQESHETLVVRYSISPLYICESRSISPRNSDLNKVQGRRVQNCSAIFRVQRFAGCTARHITAGNFPADRL